jgi:hypothetical protein
MKRTGPSERPSPWLELEAKQRFASRAAHFRHAGASRVWPLHNAKGGRQKQEVNP